MVGEVVGKSSGASFILERRLAAVGARADLVTEARRLYAEASKAGLGKLDSSGLLGNARAEVPHLGRHAEPPRTLSLFARP